MIRYFLYIREKKEFFGVSVIIVLIWYFIYIREKKDFFGVSVIIVLILYFLYTREKKELTVQEDKKNAAVFCKKNRVKQKFYAKKFYVT